jgi:3-hydroxybutyryl-CoA dehydrogenase
METGADIRHVAVIGLGTMGAGIAEVFARGGLTVTGVEVSEGALAAGRANLNKSMDAAVRKGKLPAAGRQQILERITFTTTFASVAVADLVVEAVPERIDLKRAVFAELDRLCGAGAVLATNTSSLSVTEIAAPTARPGRVIGVHFFNPAPVMRLVEVVTTVLTEPSVRAAVMGLVGALGKTPVTVPDRAGFVVNALLLPFLNHAAALLEAGYASAQDIDAAVTTGIGLPMGPLALLDLIGLDTSVSVLEVLHAEFGGQRYAPVPLLRRLVAAGLTGRKSGRGFYRYDPAEPRATLSPHALNGCAPATPPAAVTLIPAGHLPDSPASDLAAEIAAAGIGVTLLRPDAAVRTASGAVPLAAAGPVGDALVDTAGPVGGAGLDAAGQTTGAGPDAERLASDAPPVAAGPVGDAPLAAAGPVGGAGLDAAGQATAAGPGAAAPASPELVLVAAEPQRPVLRYALACGRPADAVGVHLVGGGLAEVVCTAVSSATAADLAAAVATALGRTVVRCPDRPGLLVAALLYPHLNDAVRMLAQGYASAADIDAAMMAGCGYPRGPLRMIDDIGAETVRAVLAAMYECWREPAFAPAPLLADHAVAGLPFNPAD